MIYFVYDIIYYEFEIVIKIFFIREVYWDEYEYIYVIEQESHEVFEVDLGFDSINEENDMIKISISIINWKVFNWFISRILYYPRMISRFHSLDKMIIHNSSLWNSRIWSI